MPQESRSSRSRYSSQSKKRSRSPRSKDGTASRTTHRSSRSDAKSYRDSEAEDQRALVRRTWHQVSGQETSRRSSASHFSSSTRRSRAPEFAPALPGIDESDELTPEDSVSQVSTRLSKRTETPRASRVSQRAPYEVLRAPATAEHVASQPKEHRKVSSPHHGRQLPGNLGEFEHPGQCVAEPPHYASHITLPGEMSNLSLHDAQGGIFRAEIEELDIDLGIYRRAKIEYDTRKTSYKEPNGAELSSNWPQRMHYMRLGGQRNAAGLDIQGTSSPFPGYHTEERYPPQAKRRTSKANDASEAGASRATSKPATVVRTERKRKG